MSTSNRILIGGFFMVAAALLIDNINNGTPRDRPATVQQNAALNPPAPLTDNPELIRDCAQMYESNLGLYAKNSCSVPIRVAFCQTNARYGCKSFDYLHHKYVISPGTTAKLHFVDHPGRLHFRMFACQAPRRPQLEFDSQQYLAGAYCIK